MKRTGGLWEVRPLPPGCLGAQRRCSWLPGTPRLASQYLALVDSFHRLMVQVPLAPPDGESVRTSWGCDPNQGPLLAGLCVGGGAQAARPPDALFRPLRWFRRRPAMQSCRRAPAAGPPCAELLSAPAPPPCRAAGSEISFGDAALFPTFVFFTGG